MVFFCFFSLSSHLRWPFFNWVIRAWCRFLFFLSAQCSPTSCCVPVSMRKIYINGKIPMWQLTMRNNIYEIESKIQENLSRAHSFLFHFNGISSRNAISHWKRIWQFFFYFALQKKVRRLITQYAALTKRKKKKESYYYQKELVACYFCSLLGIEFSVCTRPTNWNIFCARQKHKNYIYLMVPAISVLSTHCK